MKNLNLLFIALLFLGVALLVCLAGIIWLSAAVPAKPIPDVLVGVTFGALGTIGGLLVPTGTAAARREVG